MSVCCCICGEWYQRPGRDTLDICDDCHRDNFSGSPEMNPDAPRVETARDALEAAVDSIPRQITLTPRQVQAMRRLHERWVARSEAARAQWEEDAC